MVLLSRVLTGAMLMGGISTKPHTVWCVGLGALLGPGATGHHNRKHHVLVLCGVVVSLVVPCLILLLFCMERWLVGVGLLFGYCIVDASIL